MSTKNKRKWITFVPIPVDTPQGVLMNFAPFLLVMVSDLVMLPLCFFLMFGPHRYPATLLSLGQLTGLWLGSLWILYRPSNPFAIGEIWGKRIELRQLENSALRVLTFLKSRRAREIVLLASCVWTFIIIAAWCVATFLFEKPPPPSLESLLVGSVGSGFFFFLCGNHYALVLHYTLKHWDDIQRTYEPWPTDKPFELPLKAIWNPEAWRRST